MSTRILVGDCRDGLAALPDNSVQCIVTSPPYFGLRDYGADGQIGLEGSIQGYVDALVAVFRDARRALRKDGVMFLNLGDSYANDGKWGGKSENGVNDAGRHAFPRLKVRTGLKPKDRMMVPARVAIALQADGWWLRDEIVWAKGNPMPSNIKDRTTPSHEMVYLLSKGPRYFFDHTALMEDAVCDHASGNGFDRPERLSINGRGNQREWKPTEKRHGRSVWTINTVPSAIPHCAMMPMALAEKCLLAGSRKGDTVLDPFGGSGTTALAANLAGRDAILCELSPDHALTAARRLEADAGLFADVTLETVRPQAAKEAA